MIIPNKWWVILCYFVGSSILIVKSDKVIDVVGESNVTEVPKITEDPTTSEVPEVTTVSEIKNRTTESPTTEADFKGYESTTFTPPKNESNRNSTDERMKGFFCSENGERLNKFYKLFTPIILRFAFGVAVDVEKVTGILRNPVGIGIALFCNFLFMPLVSDDIKNSEIL